VSKPVFCGGMPLDIDEQGNVVVKLPWEQLVGRDLMEYTRVVFVFSKRGRILIVPVPKELEGLPDVPFRTIGGLAQQQSASHSACLDSTR
jgi:hypothetical protein